MCFYLNFSAVLFGFSKLNPKFMKSREAEQPSKEQVQALLCLLINSVSRTEGEEFHLGPDWFGSVDWTLSWKPKGRWFESQSGHRPVLWAGSPVEGV